MDFIFSFERKVGQKIKNRLLFFLIMKEIQSWMQFQYLVYPNDDRKFCVRIDGEGEPLPESLEKRVSDIRRKVDLKDNPVPFLYCVETNSKKEFVVKRRPYSYSHAFNRCAENFDLELIKMYHLLYLSTHFHFETGDGYLVYVTKKNQMNQISGFGGFPNLNKHVLKRSEKSFVNIIGTIKDRVEHEIGDVFDAIKKVYAIGVTYVGKPGLSGVDLNFILHSSICSIDFKRIFRESEQFNREIFFVKPCDLSAFVIDVFKNGREISPFALGCMYLLQYYFGFSPEDFLKKIEDGVGISIGIGDEIGYLHVERKI